MIRLVKVVFGMMVFLVGFVRRRLIVISCIVVFYLVSWVIGILICNLVRNLCSFEIRIFWYKIMIVVIRD